MPSVGALKRWSALGGLLFVALWVIGVVLVFSGQPDSSDPPAKFIAYFGDSGHRDRIEVGWLVAGIGLFFFLWFLVALREAVRSAEGQETFLSTLVTIGGGVYAAVAFAALGLEVGVKTMSDDTYQHQVYPGILHAADDAGYVMHATGTAALSVMIVAVTIGLTASRAIPRWLGWIGWLAALAALLSIFFLTMFVWLAWLLVLSVVLFLGSETRAPLPAS